MAPSATACEEKRRLIGLGGKMTIESSPPGTKLVVSVAASRRGITQSMQESQGLTVVLADDQNIVREGIAALCVANGMHVLGEAADGNAAIELIQSLQPEFAILDLHMPGFTGVETIRKLKSENCRTKLMILSISR